MSHLLAMVADKGQIYIRNTSSLVKKAAGMEAMQVHKHKSKKGKKKKDNCHCKVWKHIPNHQMRCKQESEDGHFCKLSSPPFSVYLCLSLLSWFAKSTRCRIGAPPIVTGLRAFLSIFIAFLFGFEFSE